MGGIGVVVEQLAHAVVDVVGEAVIKVVRLKGIAQVHLPVGHLEQLIQPLAGLGGDGDHGDAQLPGEVLHIDGVPPGLHLVHKIQGQHQGALQLQQLDGEVEVAFQVGGVHDVQNGVRTFTDDEVPGHDLLHGVGGQRVDPRQIHHRQFPVAQAGGALLFFHGHPGPVAHILIGAREGIEQGGLAAVGVARQGNAHGAAVVGAVVIGVLVLLQLVDVVLELLAGALRVGAVGGGLPGGGAAGRADADLSGVILPQGQLISTERDLQGVAQGGHLGHLHRGPRGQTHIHQPALDCPRLVAHRQDHAALSGNKILKGAGGIGLLLFHDAPSFRSRG